MALGFKSSVTSMAPSFEKVLGGAAPRKDTTEARQELSGLMEKREQAGTEYLGQREEIGKKTADIDTKIAEAGKPVRELSQQLKDKFDEPTLTFQPTKENMGDLMSLFAMTSAAAFLSGGEGRYAGMAALANLTGALEGYQKGRQDLFKQELQQYDKNIKAKQSEAQRIRDQLQVAQALATTNVNEYNALRKQLEAQLGESEAGYKVRIGDLDAAIRLKNDEIKADEGINKQFAQFLMNLYRDNKRAEVQINLQDLRDRASDRRTAARLEAQQIGRASALNQRYAFNIVESFGQAATDLLNITTLPANTTLGAFAGMSGKTGDSLLTALRNTFLRSVTPQDERLMQQMVSALDFHMSRALGGGYATSSTKSILDAYKEQVAQQGDTPAAQAMFLSRMKQELEILSKMFKNHPGSNPGYVEDMNEYVRELNIAIPFDVQDVTAASRGSRTTMTDALRSVAGKPSNIPLPVEQQQAMPPAQATVPPAGGVQQGSKPQEGQKATSKSGKPIVYRNGQWEYE